MSGTTSLSRRYRPARFADLVNQAHIRMTLEREILTDRIGHAYLFTGPRGVGKTTVARIFAKAINCQKRSGAEPCDACSTCLSFRSGRALDLIEIDAASHTQVDNVREHIIPNARTRPSQAAYKVFIIDEVHMLSLSAFNALLKVIEEPPDYVVFILATTEPDRVPETIISRCQRFDFRRLDEPALVERLGRIAEQEGVAVDQEVLVSIAELADGSVRDAESLLGQILSLGETTVSTETAGLVLPKRDRARAVAFLRSVLERDPGRAIEVLGEAFEAGAEVEHFYFDLIRIVQSALRQATAAPPPRTESDQLGGVELSRLAQLLRGLLELEPLLKVSPIPQLPLELFAVEQAGESDEAKREDTPSSKDSAKVEKTEAPRAEIRKPKLVIRPLPKASEAVNVQADEAQPTGDELTTWGALLNRAQTSNHGLAVLLNVCRPKLASSDRFVVECQFGFHRDRLNDLKNRLIVEGLLAEILGRSVRFFCELSSTPVAPTPSAESGSYPSPETTTTKKAPGSAPSADESTTWERVLATFGT